MSVVRAMIRYRSDGRATIVLEGEIDLSTAPSIQAALATCRAKKATDIDIDLTAVGFCDASGLNVFIAASRHAAAEDGDVRLHHLAPVVRLLLDVTGTGYLLTGRRPDGQAPRDDARQTSSGAP
ncbi:STAS domain-containing protein [Streptomyces sp. N50]|uniref:STAS domain-containing protein n=1 Tax=Streptomyces sp. N50 TaxID=3081765 RepID=UPI0029623B9A|nr:STAS domain-containing protein [Streptomyces sp. N50]WOX16081.1 STAS domain-containing protein [Streptomyces sp. N50]